MTPVYTVHPTDIRVDEKEVFRYLSCNNPTQTEWDLLNTCKAEAFAVIHPGICYTQFAVKSENDTVITPFGTIASGNLAKHWQNCDECVLFAATLGVEFDRLNKKTALVSPAKGVIMNALGTALIEAICDDFNETVIKNARLKNKTTRSRFSPGYGDLPLSLQTTVFDILKPAKNIGVSLNDTLFMTPIKSVTAFIGIKSE